MPGKLCIVTLMLFVQYCTAAIPACTGTTDTDKCKPPEYSGTCDNLFCACAAGFTKGTDACALVKPVIKDLPSDNKVYLGRDYNLLCGSDVIASSNPTFIWAINGTDTTVKEKTYPIKAAKESNNGDYICKVSVGSSQTVPSDKVTLTFQSGAVNTISSILLTLGGAILTRFLNTY